MAFDKVHLLVCVIKLISDFALHNIKEDRDDFSSKNSSFIWNLRVPFL
jgi:hypothetical protein